MFNQMRYLMIQLNKSFSRRKIPFWVFLLATAFPFAGCEKSSPTTGPFEIQPGLVFEPGEKDSVYDISKLLTVGIEIADDDWNKLRYERRSLVETMGVKCNDPLDMVYTYYPANVTVDGTDLGEVGVRKKGFLGSISTSRPSFKIKFQHTQEGLEYGSYKRLTLNNGQQDAVRLKTCLAYSLMARAGVPASRCSLAEVIVNGDSFGVYANAEPIKKAMLKRIFGDDTGNLYEGTVADFRKGFTVKMEKKTLEAEDDWSDVHELIDILELPDDKLLPALDKVLDIDAFLRFMAAEVLVGHWDGYSGNRNNYFFYKNPTNNKFYFIPWGPDGTFISGRGPFVNADFIPVTVWARGYLARRMHENPLTQKHFQEHLRTMINEVWKTDEILAEINVQEELISSKILETNKDDFNEEMNRLKAYIQSRPGELIQELDGPTPAIIDEIRTTRCLEDVGTINASLSGEFGAWPDDGPFNGEDASFSGNVWNIELPVAAAGAMAGYDEDDPNRIIFAFIGFLEDQSIMILFVRISKRMVVANTIIPLDGYDAEGFFLRQESVGVGSPQIVGMLGTGTIEFGDLSLENGEPVNVSLTTNVWSGAINSGEPPSFE